VTPYLWPLRNYLELGALPTAVPCARLHARHLVWEWGLNGLAESTELLVSELVTNAIKATAGRDEQAAVRLRLSSDNARVLIEVWDADPQPSAPKDLGKDGIPDPQEEGGRGLFLVAALSTRWDWYLTQEPTGKVVWCELSAEPPEPSEGAGSTPQTLLPRRVPREQQNQPIEVMNDPDVLRRVRNRLRDLSLTADPRHCHLLVTDTETYFAEHARSSLAVPSRPERPEGLIVVYDGGVLAPGEVAAITTQDGELAGYEFVEPGEVAERVSPLLARRIAACVDAVRAGTVISLEDGCPVT
jgi:anti-sigma regulatory factor (Ser/Thr protein kinase)